MNIQEKEKFARRFYDSYAFVLMETEEDFSELYKVFKFRCWREDENLSNDDIQDIWKIVVGEYVKDGRKGKFDKYEERKRERKYLLKDAKKCLHKFHNEELRSIIFENNLRDIEDSELNDYWGISQSDLIKGYDENITKATIDAYSNVEDNRKMITEKVSKLSPMAIARITEIIKEDG